MPWALFLLIAAVWAMFLVPRWWADRASFDPDPSPRPRQSGSKNLKGELFQGNTRVLRSGGTSQPADSRVSHREAVLARRRRMMLVLLSAAAGTLMGWFLLASMWMLLAHVIVDAVLVWYIMMLRRLRTFREDVNALFDSDEHAHPARNVPGIEVVRPR